MLLTINRSLGAALAATLLAGCGGSSSGGTVTQRGSTTREASVATITRAAASTTSSTTAGSPAKPSRLAFAVCMRAHGVPDFPDPTRLPTANPGAVPTAQPAPSGGFTANPSSPAYERASNDCRSLADASPVGQAQADLINAEQLKFSVCMRANGVPNYPDPSAGGQIGDNGSINGANENAPAVQSAAHKCSRYQPRPPGAPSSP